MNRDDFIKQLEELTGWGVGSIQWVYGKSYENVSEEGELYYCDCTLQVMLYDGTILNHDSSKQYISITADSYCYDNADIVGSLADVLEVNNSMFADLKASVDIDKVFSLMYNYLIEYGDTSEKPFMDCVFFESI